MAEAKTSAKASLKVPDKSTVRSSVLPDSPVTDPVATADLSKVIEELQKRLSQVEKRRTTASPRRRKATTDTAPDATATPIAETTLSNPAAVEARLVQLRDLEHAMHLEEIALYTRAKAAAQEEMLIRHESQTLRLKLRSFRAMTQRLTEQESKLTQGLADLDAKRGQLEEERAAFELKRQQLESARAQLDADRAALAQRQSRPSKDESTLAVAVGSLQTTPAPTSADVEPATFSPKSHRMLWTVSLAALALTTTLALCVTLAWLTIMPIYRASATMTGLPVDDAALVQGTSDHSAWLTDAMLATSMNTLEARGRRPFADVASMRQSLKQAMMLSRNEDGSIEIMYESPHRNEAIFVLDSVIRSLLTSKTPAAASRNIRLTRAAAADLDPVRDGRLSGAMFYFALIAGLVAGLLTLRHNAGKIYSLMSFKKGSFSR